MKQSIVKGLLFLLITISMILPCGCNGNTPTDNYPPLPTATLSVPSNELINASQPYHNEDYKFSTRYCNEMQLVENQGAAVAFLGDMLGDMAHFITISVVVKELPKKTSLRDYIEQNKQAGETALQDYSLISEEELTVAGTQAIKVMYSFAASVGDYNYTFENTMTSFVKGKNVYNVIYSVPDEVYNQYKDCYDLILYTFEFN
jgi:hypothetical protein